MTKLLEAHGISKSYRCGKPIISDASFCVDSGEIVSITGQSGQGKSTIARILCGAIHPDSGTVHFGGKLLIGEDEKYNTSVLPRIQLIQQQPFGALDPKQRIIDAVAEPILVNRLVQTKAEAIYRAEELLASVWLGSELFYRLPSQISGGQAQRTIIARAMGVEPRLIIADEATSMLDILSQAQVIGIFRRLSEKNKIAILLISHDIQLVKAVAHRGYNLCSAELTETKEDNTK